MPLNLSEAFELIPGIYVIGPRSTKASHTTLWKVGMGTSLRSRLSDYQICFPEGFYIRLLLTLPPPEGQWRDDKVRRAIRLLESRILQKLKEADDIEHIKLSSSRSEWFRGRFVDVQAVIIDALTELGLQDYVRVHTDLAGAKYGPLRGSKGRDKIPQGDSIDGIRDAPELDEYLEDLSGREKTAVEALMDLSRDPPLDGRLKVLNIPRNPRPDREYTVARLVDDRMKDGRKQFKVRWRGYTARDDTWEDRDSLMENASLRVEEYESTQRAAEAADTMLSLPSHGRR